MSEQYPPDSLPQETYQVAYVFDPQEDAHPPHKKRRVARPPRRGDGDGDGDGGGGGTATPSSSSSSSFVPLLNGAEGEEFVRLRRGVFGEAWGVVRGRIETIMRESNSATLEDVSRFVASSKTDCLDQIPSAFIITGPNIASQDLLFEQLSESLPQRSSPSRFVRLKSSETLTLKAALKKTIRDATACAEDTDRGADGDDLQIENTPDGRRYLDYDLEALEAYVKRLQCQHVFVAFQDSEGFESGLLSDLITLFHSWRPRIPFTLLFGIATSVDLLQARLLKSACRLIYGGQFDGVQTASILETVFKGAVASADVPLRLGAPLLRSMLERQHEQVAGIQSFISSLKYAYMCHFYANPLSVLCSPSQQDVPPLQKEHLEALRNLPSFRQTVEREVDNCTPSSLRHAKALLEDDDYLRAQVHMGYSHRRAWEEEYLRFLLVLQAAGVQQGPFSRVYVDGMARDPQLSSSSSSSESQHADLAQAIRRMDSESLCTLLRRVIPIFQEGDPSLNLGAAAGETDTRLVESLQTILEELEALKTAADKAGIILKSKYSSHGKVLRTTVIAQKVQLCQDSATLRDEDKKLTELIDDFASLLSTHFHARTDSDEAVVLFSECWLYESKSPARDVFVPRPRNAFERSLTRPHDYLNCACCKPDSDGLQATLPATAILYQLYLESGSLINVADLWSAFHTLVSREEDDKRKALVMFYRGLAELRALGFVKSSKKKVDHIAKVKWL
ncbi:related to origin recognition complex subunit 3 [Claviceps purpurea 20.1]|uniref:Related to origin recognition complex subunit 3 n=1 Tax=Claviceps purpurea (strain 20.1) TaxID=1111077 RepID=M1WHP8_CLAP2|nr:related to origin recognition complex subunit 3 [Claviceps purpurea 20.1]